MGAPGKIVRDVDEALVASLRQSAVHYQKNMRRFRDELTEV
jgi:carbonic anhydrase/acetyltransferase-like protein (isoleucine patch superfamily)